MSKKKRNPGLCESSRPVLETHAAGVDVGAREMYVAVAPDRDTEPVRVFRTFTSDLQALVKWIQKCCISQPSPRNPPARIGFRLVNCSKKRESERAW